MTKRLFRFFQEKKRLEQIVNLYEDRMQKLCHYEKYRNIGQILLSAVVPDDTVYLIASSDSILDLLSKPLRCKVNSIEFVGGNNSIIHLCDENGQEYIVHNNDWNKIFFHDFFIAKREIERREKFLERKWGI